MLLRFSGPLPLLELLEGAPLRLHRPDAARVHLGDAQLWDWPGVREFGAIAVLDVDRFDPVGDAFQAAAGWSLLTPSAAAKVGPDDALYVPDAESAAAIAGARRVSEAQALLPTDRAHRVVARRAALLRYRDQLPAIEAVHAAGWVERLPPELRRAFDRPFHMVPAELREAVHAAALALGCPPTP